MITDARQLSSGSTHHADICIVGGGPAGITLARELAGSGMTILLLEAGGGTETPAGAELAAGESVGHPYFPLSDTRVHALGGTSHRWRLTAGFRARPLDEIDFEHRHGVHPGWPFGLATLAPFYERAHEVLDVGSFDFDPDHYADPLRRPMLELDPSLAETVLFHMVETEGMVRYAGDLRRSEDLDVWLHAHVVSIETRQDPATVDRVRVTTSGGAELLVEAAMVVLAAGGIGNPRLMLLSRETHAAGLGNDNDLVGRFFMEHLNVRCATVVPADGVDLDTSFYDKHDVRGETVQAKLAPAQAAVRSEGILNVTFFVERMSAARADPAVRSLSTLQQARRHRPRPEDVSRHVASVVRAAPRVVRRLAERDSSAIVLRAMSEQAPNRASRVTLGHSRDPFGLPCARLDFQPGPLDRWSIERAEEIVGEAIERAGLGRLRDRFAESRPPAKLTPQWHHIGTTRMGEDPTESVVDPDCRVHGFENLYVAGSSVFPSSGYANPTLTIVALAIRLADHLKALVDPGGSAAKASR